MNISFDETDAPLAGTCLMSLAWAGMKAISRQPHNRIKFFIFLYLNTGLAIAVFRLNITLFLPYRHRRSFGEFR